MELFEAIRGRRSIRRFKSKALPDELLMKVLEAARWAPSNGNLQSWEFLVIKEDVRKNRIARATNQYFVAEAPVVIVACANKAKSSSMYGEKGNFYCILDTAAAVQNILLAAHALGLGACWVGTFNETALSGLLELPDYIRPVAVIPLGYSDERPSPPSRDPLLKVVHRECFSIRLRKTEPSG